MARVALRSPLRELADGHSEVSVTGSTVGEVLAGLERRHPRLSGWVRDERGDVREHIGVFVNGERASAGDPVGERDRVHVLPAISGGAVSVATRPAPQALGSDSPDDPVEVLVGTNKGLVVLRGPRGGPMEVAGRRFEGRTVEFAMRDPRSGRYFASVTRNQFGPGLYRSMDPLAAEWEQSDGPTFPEDTGAALERIWLVRTGEPDGVLWAGVAPAALFRSDDGGLSWSLVRALWDEPSRAEWQPGAGGLCLHSICPWPGDPDRLAVGISAAGVWLTEDGGATWRRGTRGLVARYLPEEAREDAIALCVHNMHRAPMEPDTLYLQFHGGVYRSDDAGEAWNDIGAGLPSDFGFPAVTDPFDPDRLYVIPMNADLDRVTCDGHLRVYRTDDRGATWRPLTEGLPQRDAYATVLRQAFCHDRRSPLGLYFGTEQGAVYGSADGGETWTAVAEHLPPVTSVRCSS